MSLSTLSLSTSSPTSPELKESRDRPSSVVTSVHKVDEGALLDLGKKTVTAGATRHIGVAYPLQSLHQSLREQLIAYRLKQVKGKS
jgi:hypothetical protein